MSNVNKSQRGSSISIVASKISDVPDAPTIGAATVTNGTTVSIPFTAAVTGGTPTSYTVAATPTVGDISTNAGTTSPRTTTGTFASNTAYTFTIRGGNSTATGAISSASNSVTPYITVSVDYLVVAGGGASGDTQLFGGGCGGGAGGAGGLRSTITASGGSPGTVESALALNLSTNYTVTVGAGGTAISDVNTNGINSVFSTIISIGGGKGGNNATGSNPGAGGSGGGGSGHTLNAGQTGGSGTANQGYGGQSSDSNTGQGKGGGGAASAGNGQTGGSGRAVAISGSSVTYAAGGSTTSTAAGGANTGNGGSVLTANSSIIGKTGGSGIVILRYPNTKTITIGAGLTGSTATDGSYKVTTITAGTGNVSWA